MNTIRRNPDRGDQQSRAAFVDQTAAPDTTRLHCFIPSELHRQFKTMAFEGNTHMTLLVIEAMQNYLAERQGSP